MNGEPRLPEADRVLRAPIVQLFSDFVCPFCFVAEAAVVPRLVRDLAVRVQWRGFELHPETPTGGIRVADYFGEARFEAMRAHLERFAASFGIEDLRPPDILPNTRKALALAELARDLGKLDEYRERASVGYFRRSLDLGDDDTLIRLSQEVGIDTEQARQALGRADLLERVDANRAMAARLGVTGVPTYIIGDQRVVGCQTFETLASAIAAAREGAPASGALCT